MIDCTDSTTKWAEPKVFQVTNELTVENIGEGIKEFIRYQANLPNGPDLGSDVIVMGLVRDEDLRKVLEVKGEIVIRIKGVPETLLDVDSQLPVMTEGRQQLEELARSVGARKTEVPLCVD